MIIVKYRNNGEEWLECFIWYMTIIRSLEHDFNKKLDWWPSGQQMWYKTDPLSFVFRQIQDQDCNLHIVKRINILSWRWLSVDYYVAQLCSAKSRVFLCTNVLQNLCSLTRSNCIGSEKLNMWTALKWSSNSSPICKSACSIRQASLDLSQTTVTFWSRTKHR